MAAIRGAVSIGRKANSSLFPVPRYLRTRFHVPAASHPFHGPISHAHRPSGLKYPIRAIHEATVNPVAPSKDDVGKSPDNWKVKMLYDGECPLCMREVNMLRERDKQYGAIKFVDISSDEYSPKENQGLDYETVMGRIHAILSDGTVVTDVENFCRHSENYMKQLIWDGFMPLQNINRLQQLLMRCMVFGLNIVFKSQVLHVAQHVVAFDFHLNVLSRPSLEEVLEARKNKFDISNKHFESLVDNISVEEVLHLSVKHAMTARFARCKLSQLLLAVKNKGSW
ncbi:hypothetical protein RHGRI_034891 [Rhododendron griersonianum]|uniref:Uncharacterized protein n=1 Tax=Rhododendron griersonianum TaxID=479676 RepID=A0AAV6I2J6_9ERIC|nr:hypothetical protein RHGRI_034891 [Rhododendron griersonianum]